MYQKRQLNHSRSTDPWFHTIPHTCLFLQFKISVVQPCIHRLQVHHR